MNLEIKHFTDEDQRVFKEKHELGEPKEWAVMDSSIVWGFYDTKEEADKDLRELVLDDQIFESFEAWVDDTATHFGITAETIREIVSTQVK